VNVEAPCNQGVETADTMVCEGIGREQFIHSMGKRAPLYVTDRCNKNYQFIGSIGTITSPVQSMVAGTGIVRSNDYDTR
jgi:hypothetical protein